MIENVILLLIANTVIPYFPVPPVVFLPVPFLQLPLQQPSVFENMNLTRIYKSQDFKRVFRESLRVHHPDHGGNTEIFQQIQGLKKIMQQPINYYDLYNVTSIDLSNSMSIKEVIQIKEVTFYVELGIFYFITLLYILAFTLEDDSRSARYLMLPLALAFLAYEYYIHSFPQTTTVIDIVNPHIPLFVQRKFLKRTLIVFLAIIRSHFLNKKTDQKILEESLKKQMAENEYKDTLERLTAIYHNRAIEKQKYEKSIWAKLKNGFSKLLSGLFLLLMIKNMLHL